MSGLASLQKIFDPLGYKLTGGDKAAESPPIVIPPPPPSAPTIDDARRQRETSDMALRRKGRAATILSGSGGVTGETVQAKTLIGS